MSITFVWSILRRRLVAGLSPRRFEFVPRPNWVGFVVDKVAVGQVFLRVLPLFACYHHSTIAPDSFIHQPPTLSNVFLPVLQISPVSIIPPLLHTHPLIYHPHCIMFFSQYFSFPLSVSFHRWSILIFIDLLLSTQRQTDEAWEPWETTSL